MPYIILIIVLCILLLVVSIKLFIMKKELRKITNQMTMQDNTSLSVQMVDEDLNQLIVSINHLYEKQLEIKNRAVSKEKEIRNSISVISHDMKTPLTSVIGYLQMAQKSQGEEMQNDIATALERAIYLNDLVNDFFEISLIDAESYLPNLESINICELICEEIFALSPAFDKKGMLPVFEKSDKDIRVLGDKKMCTRVFQNYFSNCIKYGVGEITIDIDEDTSDKVKIRICNYPKNEVDPTRMFERYYRDDKARTGEGAGLGMFICKNFVEAMKGTILAEMNGEQLVTTICLPAQQK